MLCLARAWGPMDDQTDEPSPFGGAGGLSGERPPLDASDAQLDAYCERLYNARMIWFELSAALNRKPRRKKRFRDYTKRNAEECYGRKNAKA